jgi:HD-GYP domain-containing protein (c-di-GMP phosphodiesterase class II)
MLNRLRQAYIPILTQITVPYVLLAIIIAAGGTYVITQVVVDSVEERFTNQLIETGLLAGEAVVREEDELLEALRLVSNIQGVDIALRDRDVSTLRTLALPVSLNSGVEAVVFLDLNGSTIISLSLDSAAQQYINMVPATSYRNFDFVQQVLAGELDELGDKFSGVDITSAGTFIFIAGPVHDVDGKLTGVAMVGRSVDNMVRLLGEEVLGHLTVYSFNGEALSSTLVSPSGLAAEQADLILARQDEGSLRRSITDSGITYSELLTAFEVRSGIDLGVMGVALPTNFLVQTTEVTRTNTFILMSVALLLVIIVGALVAGRITAPIRDLKEAALRVSEGHLNVQVTPARRDEVGILTTSFNEMVRNLNRSKKDLLDTYDKTIEGWARALDLRDHETEGHSRRVTEMAERLGRKMGMNEDELRQLHRGGLLHDIGKIAIPDAVLLKRDKLTPKEVELIRHHPQFAKSFMEQIEFLKPAMAVPYSHHEKWDGSGYPEGLKGEKIPMLARIFAVADVWDALTSERPYRRPISFSEALDYIRSESGKHFDPKVVEAFTQVLGEMLKEQQRPQKK